MSTFSSFRQKRLLRVCWMPASFLVCTLSVCSMLRAAERDLESLASAAQDSKQAAALAQSLQRDPETKLMDVLAAMKSKSAVSQNWYLSIAQSVADRNPQESALELEQFLPRLSEDPTARYWAFIYVTRNDAAKKEKLLESMLADPSLELRFEAVALGIQRLETAGENQPQSQLVQRYRELLSAARLPEQVQQIAKKLEELDHKVSLLEHFGFLSHWNVIGTFDNKNQAGFDVVYGPEADYVSNQTNASKKFMGMSGEVGWQPATTEKEDGAIDLNAVFNNEKGAIVYALGEFKSAGEMECEVRLGSPNACQIWVNGSRVMHREVYHTATQIDQYVAPVTLKAGMNSVLVKVCQNEQTETWAQDWLFQLRFTDSSGLAIAPVP